MPSLSSQDREFFTLVSQAVYENPFGEERDRLDTQIAQADAKGPELMERLIHRVEERLRTLVGDGEAVPDYEPEDRALLEHGLLFATFHRFVPEIDTLIADQRDRKGKDASAPFAPAALGYLTRAGYHEPRAIRMLELFFQMRRAWMFIGTGLVGQSRSMRRLREHCWDSVFTHDIRRYDRFLWNRMEDFSTILLGETGTGKGAAAAAIGLSGFIEYEPKTQSFAQSFDKTLISINLSQFPETLIESELFGHKKGAFTGAVDSHEGVFARCCPHGAIFVDEIGEVSVPVQIKLLRVLQERVFSPVGSHEERRFEGRVIAATHRPLDELRESGSFRDDFYYRLSANVITVPRLAQRLEEAPAELSELIAALLPRLVGESTAELEAEVKAAIDRDLGPSYPWPGNVRELEQCIRRVLLTQRCQPDSRRREEEPETLAQEIQAGALTAEALVARYCKVLYEKHGTYVEVAKLTGLDRRTVRKYIQD
ncbi:MAG: sigma 54-interacting transcriptional regulator [Myxococcota bacterium]